MTDLNATSAWSGDASTHAQCDQAISTRLYNHIHVTRYITFLTVLSAVCLLGILGNMCVVLTYVIKRNKSTANYLMLVLACVDLSSCTLLHPYVIYKHARYYSTHEGVCKVFEYLIHYMVAVHLGIFTTVVVDRYYVVCRPARFVHSYNRIVAMTFMTVFGSLFLCSPLLIFFGHKTVTLQTAPCVFQSKVCDINSLAKESQVFNWYVWASFVFMILSVLFIIVMYLVIHHTVRRKRREVVPGGSGALDEDTSQDRTTCIDDTTTIRVSPARGIIKPPAFDPVSIKLEHAPAANTTVGIGHIKQRQDSISMPGVEVPYDSPPPSPSISSIASVGDLASDMCLETRKQSLVLPMRQIVDSADSILEVNISEPATFLSARGESPALMKSLGVDSYQSDDSAPAYDSDEYSTRLRKHSVCLPAITISKEISQEEMSSSNESLDTEANSDDLMKKQIHDHNARRRCVYLDQFDFMSHRNSLTPSDSKSCDIHHLTVHMPTRRASDSFIERRGYIYPGNSQSLSVEEALFTTSRDTRERAQSTPDTRCVQPVTDFTIYNCVHFLSPYQTSPRSRKPSLKKTVMFEEEEFFSPQTSSIATTLKNRGGRNQASIQFAKIFFIVIFTFLFSWIPYWVINIMEIVSPAWSHSRLMQSGIIGCLYNLFYIDNAVNPLFYVLLSPVFRDDLRACFKQLLKGKFRCFGPTPRAWKKKKEKSKSES